MLEDARRVRSHAARTSSVRRKYPHAMRFSTGSLSLRYVGLEAAYVISCHAFIANWNPAGASRLHFAASATGGGW